ncbi:MAG: ParA family protein [Synechococcaceae cyanobacterium SM2_3_2]|nr:ParA family protein [Synechococcaceae cyanobacterium SM2_3_2]
MLITVASFKGGVGKSVTALHLSGYLSTQKSTVLIDGDPNRTAINWAARGPGLPFPVLPESEGSRVGEFAHAVVDTAARPDSDDLKTLIEVSDLVVVPTIPDAVALDATLATCETLQRMGSTFRVAVVMVPPIGRDGVEACDYLKGEGIPVFETLIRRYAAYGKAALAGVLVGDAKDPRAKIAARDYAQLGREVISVKV